VQSGSGSGAAGPRCLELSPAKVNRLRGRPAAKGGVVAFTRTLARALGAHNICVNLLAPGLSLSDSIQVNRAHRLSPR
jgi:NAD(P)-dependent dehydrogenase (short-subunit alcohol dehydrogenase family)